MRIIMAIQSYSFDSAVELNLRNGCIEDDVLISTYRNITRRVEFNWALSIDLTCSLLLLVVCQLNKSLLTHF